MFTPFRPKFDCEEWTLKQKMDYLAMSPMERREYDNGGGDDVPESEITNYFAAFNDEVSEDEINNYLNKIK